jgi:hypothetical protein
MAYCFNSKIEAALHVKFVNIHGSAFLKSTKYISHGGTEKNAEEYNGSSPKPSPKERALSPSPSEKDLG